MSFALETAADPANLRRVAIDPLSRVEGHGKVTLLLDDDNKVQQVRPAAPTERSPGSRRLCRDDGICSAALHSYRQVLVQAADGA